MKKIITGVVCIALLVVLLGCPEPGKTDTKYTVTYDSQGGSAVETASVTGGEKAARPTDPVKEGYSLAGWYKEADCTNVWNFDSDTVTADITLYAKWSLNSYTVTFNVNGGSDVTSVSATHGSKLTAPTAPTKSGCGFDGWYKEEALTTAWDFDKDTVTASITLYAKWSTNSYTVTYNTNGGSEVASVSAAHAAKLTAPTAPTKTGYGFDGWYKEEALTTAWDFETDTVTAAVTLYAKWKTGSFTISYELNGGTNAAENPANYTIETADITLSDAAKTGYAFAGWFEKEDLSGDAVTKIVKGSSGDKKIYAKWTAVTYNIVYELNSGTNAAANPAAYTIETNTITLSAPSRTGYTFGGWFTASDFSGTAVTEITKGSTGEKKVYAKWLQNYSITYELNSGTNNASNPATYHAETNTITLASPTRTSRVFDGWYVNADFSGSAITSVTTGSTGNKTFYAKWKFPEYNLKDVGPAGGWIFYIRKAVDCDPNVANDDPKAWKYLEVAHDDLANQKWSNINEPAGCSNTAYDDNGAGAYGKENTAKILIQEGHETSAAKDCTEYEVIYLNVAYSDWYLPSREETHWARAELFTASPSLGNFADGWYLTSSETSSSPANQVWLYSFSNDNYQSAFKGDPYKVRAVRRF